MASGDNCSAVHLWICDDVGGVHVLCHVTSDPETQMKWRQVEETSPYGSVVGGANDSVCSVVKEDGELHVRDKINYSNPLGKAWLPTRCHVTKVAIGSKYLVAVLREGGTLIGNIGRVRSSSYCPIKWEEISPPFPPKLAHVTMTTSDFLYGVTEGGEVHGCHGISDDTRPIKWEKLSKPPIVSMLGYISSLFRATSQLLFDNVTTAAEGLWCYSKRNDTLWLFQLPNSGFSTSCSWKSFSLKSPALKLASISGHPNNLLTIYGITEDGQYLYEMNGKEVESVLSLAELPYHGHGDIVMTTVACSLLTGKEELNNEPSLYPKLPKIRRENDDEVIDTSDTLFTFDNYQEQSCIERKRRRNFDDESYETKRGKDDTDLSYLSPCQQITVTTPTRTKMYRHPFTHKLIRDIPVTIIAQRKRSCMKKEVKFATCQEILKKYSFPSDPIDELEAVPTPHTQSLSSHSQAEISHSHAADTYTFVPPQSADTYTVVAPHSHASDTYTVAAPHSHAAYTYTVAAPHSHAADTYTVAAPHSHAVDTYTFVPPHSHSEDTHTLTPHSQATDTYTVVAPHPPLNFGLSSSPDINHSSSPSQLVTGHTKYYTALNNNKQ